MVSTQRRKSRHQGRSDDLVKVIEGVTVRATDASDALEAATAAAATNPALAARKARFCSLLRPRAGCVAASVAGSPAGSVEGTLPLLVVPPPSLGGAADPAGSHPSYPVEATAVPAEDTRYQVPAPRFPRNPAPPQTPADRRLSTVAPRTITVIPGGQPAPAPAPEQAEPPQLVRSKVDNQLHLVPGHEIRAAGVVGYARSLCQRMITDDERVVRPATGESGGICASCIAAGTGLAAGVLS